MEHRKRVRFRVEHPLVQRYEIFIRKKQKEVLETAQTKDDRQWGVVRERANDLRLG